jgi:hypothetical protein
VLNYATRRHALRIARGFEPVLVEESRIDEKPLNASVGTDISRDRLGRKVLLVAPEPHINEDIWLDLIRNQSDAEVARLLGVSDRQVRRIKTGKVSTARLREHVKRDRCRLGEDHRPCQRRLRAAFYFTSNG